jgi:hypothetical protein
MHMRFPVLLLLLAIGVSPLWGQAGAPAGGTPSEEIVDSNEPTATDPAVSTSKTSTVTSTTTEIFVTTQPVPPGWVHLVRVSALAGPIAFLLLAWVIGAFVHVRLVRREQEQFPAVRGSRAPQTTPMLISAFLFFVPFVLFILFEVRSRQEIRLGIPGINDEWQPVTSHAWLAFVVCLVLALVPWLFARRADTVARGRA